MVAVKQSDWTLVAHPVLLVDRLDAKLAEDILGRNSLIDYYSAAHQGICTRRKGRLPDVKGQCQAPRSLPFKNIHGKNCEIQ